MLCAALRLSLKSPEFSAEFKETITASALSVSGVSLTDPFP